MELMTTHDAVIIVLIVLVLVLVGVFAATGRIGGFTLFPASTAAQTPQQDIAQSTQVIGSWVLLFGALGFLAIGVTGCGSVSGKVTSATFWQMIGTDSLIALAAGAVGGLLGFLFGVPRTVDAATGAVAVVAKQAAQAAQAVVAAQGNAGQAAAGGPAAQAGGAAPAAANRQAQLAPNTNLERISDWLTTLLLGATLAQGRTILKWLAQSGQQLGVGKCGNGCPDETLIPVVIVYFLVLGFLGIYLITRLYLTMALGGTLSLLTGSTPSAPASNPAQPTPLGLSTPTLPDGAVNEPYPATSLQATGSTAPLAWSVSPALPAGLTLDAAAGTIGGTPTAAAARATYTFTVTECASPPRAASAAADLEVR